MKIGNHEIKEGNPFIICEIGSNWTSFEEAKDAIRMAKSVGAHAVKFQLYTQKELYGLDKDYVDFDCMPREWIPWLAEKAKLAGIEFMCSAFSPDGYRFVDPYVNVHKVASAELTHIRILETLHELGKPVILSTGASGGQDIYNAVNILWPQLCDTPYEAIKDSCQTVLLYCVSAYPAQNVDFRHIKELKNLGCWVGFSDHTLDYTILPKMAVDQGAVIIEKHMTTIPEIRTPDRPHSLTPDQFKKMVQYLNGTLPFTWGSGEEKQMHLRHNRRLVATRNIKAGDVFSELVETNAKSNDGHSDPESKSNLGDSTVGGFGNFGIFRSLQDDTHGLNPFKIKRVQGQKAKRDIKAGETIGPGDY